jgi:hypothetical protein
LIPSQHFVLKRPKAWACVIIRTHPPALEAKQFDGRSCSGAWAQQLVPAMGADKQGRVLWIGIS